MTLHSRLARLEAASATPGGGVAVDLADGRFEYQGRVYASFDDLPDGGYLVVPGMSSLADWESAAATQINTKTI